MSAISKSVRAHYLEYLEQTGMSVYEFSKRSGISQGTLWNIKQKEDYEVRETNIRKIARGMGVPPSMLFDDESNAVYLDGESEIWLVKNFRRMSERQKGRLEGYIKALIDNDEDINL